MKRARVDQILKEKLKLHQGVIPLKDQIPVHTDLPVIVNIVATVKLLPDEEKYKFPLEAIAKVCTGFSQFAPCKFAADILRLEDSTTDTTALVFRSGKIVIVSGVTIEHVRYCIQVFRSIIEKIECVMLDEQGRIVIETLQGKTMFNGCKIHNIVGNGDLDQRVDLKALRDAAPDVVKWEPDIFPGAKCTVFLTKSRTCECRCECNGGTAPCMKRAKKKCPKPEEKCRCTCRTLIFDSGKVVVTGGQSIPDVNQVFFFIKNLARDYVDTEDSVPKEQRFAHRFGKILQNGYGQKLAEPKVKKRKKKQKTNSVEEDNRLLEADEAMALVVMEGGTKDNMITHKRLRYHGDYDKSVTPFMKACDLGQYENVKTLLELDPSMAKVKDSAGRTALDRLFLLNENEKDPSGAHDDIISLLRESD